MAPVNDDDDGTHGTRTMAMLTRRLLVWRALVGEKACPVGEWARREVVLALRGAICTWLFQGIVSVE
ncbi:hypothetical protein JVT61DRAFT_12278 [Boletus reticuloceps]|nr:hypothetical protein JVT61DRAFT_12278 [Boletus reticuloceps]